MEALDTNHDGELSAEEIANAPASLKKLDKNGDGKLTEDELRPPARPGDRGGDFRPGRNGAGPEGPDDGGPGRGQGGFGGDGVVLAAVRAAIPVIAQVRAVSLDGVAATAKGDRAGDQADLLRRNASSNMRCVSTPMATAS